MYFEGSANGVTHNLPYCDFFALSLRLTKDPEGGLQPLAALLLLRIKVKYGAILENFNI